MDCGGLQALSNEYVIVEIDGIYVLDLSLDKIVMALATAGKKVKLVVSTIEAASKARKARKKVFMTSLKIGRFLDFSRNF